MAASPLTIAILAILVLSCVCDAVDVVISDINTTWYEASVDKNCKLAGMDRQGTFNMSEIDVSGGVPQVVWIGAHVQWTEWINITGCFNDTEPDEGFDMTNSSDPVEFCLHKCVSTEFALTSTHCYCVNAKGYPSRGIPCTGDVCGGGNNRLCGNNSQSTRGQIDKLCKCHYVTIPRRLYDDIKTEYKRYIRTERL